MYTDEELAWLVLASLNKSVPVQDGTPGLIQEIIRRLKLGGISELTIRNTLLEPKKELNEHLRKV